MFNQLYMEEFPMTKKYEITDLQHPKNPKLHRIRALRDFGDVKTGDLGGFIEHEGNLSHYYTCWIYDDAQVSGKASVEYHSQVMGNAKIKGKAKIDDFAKVSGNVKVKGKARIDGDVEVFDDVKIKGKVHLTGNVRIHGKAEITDSYYEVLKNV